MSSSSRRHTKPIVSGTVLLLLALACGDRKPAADQPPPELLAAHRSTILDSALATAGITVEYRWQAPDTAVAGAAASVHWHPYTGESIRLFDTVAFDLDGVAAARVVPAEAGAMVTLQLTMPGGQRLLHTTAGHEGERIGVLVNGRLVTLATVRTALTNMLPVVDLVPRDQAEALAGRINARIREAAGAAPRR